MVLVPMLVLVLEPVLVLVLVLLVVYATCPHHLAGERHGRAAYPRAVRLASGHAAPGVEPLGHRPRRPARLGRVRRGHASHARVRRHGQSDPGSHRPWPMVPWLAAARAASRCSPGPPACSGLPSSLGCRGDYGGVLVPAPTSPAPLPFERCPLWPRRCTTGKAMPATLPPDLIPPSKRR